MPMWQWKTWPEALCFQVSVPFCERNISRMLWRIFFKFGANVHMESRTNWLDFVGHRSKASISVMSLHSNACQLKTYICTEANNCKAVILVYCLNSALKHGHVWVQRCHCWMISLIIPTHCFVCSDTQLEVNGICEVKPPQSWCVMYPDLLYEVASIGTTCTAKVSQQGDQIIVNQTESSSWELSEVGKLNQW